MNVRKLGRQFIQRVSSETEQKSLLATLMNLVTDASSEELLDHISTIILAGNETISGSLTWTLYELAKEPKYQERLREEIMKLEREPTYEELMNDMPFLDAVMMETFRHRPANPHTERVALKDDVIRLQRPVYDSNGQKITEISIKAGQLIHIPSISLTHIKSVWGPDAEDFNPERWLDPARIPPASETCGGWGGLFVFSEGARMCIGYRLAILEFKVILSTYIRHFVFHDTGASISHRFGFALHPYIVGEEAQGSQLPLRVTLVDP
ncbi:cytochrome P450 family protein [Ceratobasidium sp. AG-Ba]|nr:cytochrome P450 family protein [Ceratobasidium sp. AG-Ba]